jgi:MFS transporter, FSR family, fosmidomycin resistance protein
MSQAVSLSTRRASEARVVVPVCVAHFLSHYYIIILAPLFEFVRADYGVSYTDLALALTVFNLVSAAVQTPAGFLVDRIGARIVLLAGVALGTCAFAAAGLINSFAVFIAMFGVAGFANTAYHPADYSLLSHHTTPARIGQIFSFHTFAGILGGAVAPVTLLAMQSKFGWRGAFVGAATLGVAVLIMLVVRRPALTDRMPARTGTKGSHTGAGTATGDLKFLLSAPILLNLCFFILTSLMGGLSSFLIVALSAAYGTPTTLANVALTTLLLMNALGVLVGGLIASRTRRHAAVAAVALAVAGAATALVGIVGFSASALIALACASGLFTGVASPSRDMLVRAVTPLGAFGRVFGFVSSGYNIGAMIAPMLYGMLMDRGEPRAVFFFSAACSILCIGTVLFGFSGRGQD